MFRRVQGAMADAAETLRQAFAGLKVKELAPERFRPQGHGWKPLQGAGQPALQALVTEVRALPLLRESVEERTLEPFHARVVAEAGWARWGAEAEVVQMAPLEAGRVTRLAVPPLPRRPPARGQVEAFTPPAVRSHADPLRGPATRRLGVNLVGGAAQAGLPVMLSMPIPIQGESIQRLPKGLWMRYSLELVRATGENVRNLEVLGLFRIPRRGVTDLRHDPKASRILVRLDEAALRAPRAPFILARRKDDGSLLSCFVEAS